MTIVRIADHIVTTQADKALSGASGGFSWFGGRAEKYENAADLYTQAANAFRVQKLSEKPLHPPPVMVEYATVTDCSVLNCENRQGSWSGL